jgi:hypothetical protein
VRRGGPDLLSVQLPAAGHLLGAQLHVGRVGAGLRLAVADGELDLRGDDLRQELALEPVVAVPDQGLADDADALADLRRAALGRLVQDCSWMPPLAPPYSWATSYRASRARRACACAGRIHDLGHVLAADVGVGRCCSSRNPLHLAIEVPLLRSRLKFMAI